MKIRSFYAGFVAASLMVSLPLTNAWSATKAEAEEAIAAADAARKQAASVGGEWRDTGKMIKEATSLLDTREYTKAIGLANKAKKQGELGYQQAMDQKDAGMSDYFKTGGEAKQTAVAGAENMIAPDLESIEVMHNGEKVVIMRHHDKDATLPAEFLKTDRGCPPFCVQPIVAAEGVDTIAELELIDYLGKGDESILVVDSRTPDWVMRGTIPGSVNIPWNTVSQDSMSGMFGDSGQSPLDGILQEQFGATKTDAGWDFSGAKTLVLFCNGIWCPQSSTNIETLIKLGYPAEKLKWYRGGMQDWVSVGLTTVKP
jgi:rhodanese-related sulfurtransferase